MGADNTFGETNFNPYKMKTIYLKAEVTESHNEYSDYVIIGGNRYILMKKDLEQAQVLAVEELLEKDWGKERLTISVENQGRGTVFVDSSNTRKPKQTQIQELTELVRGKERTLEDVVRDIINEYSSKNMSWDFIQKKIKEAEQLLKKSR